MVRTSWLLVLIAACAGCSMFSPTLPGGMRNSQRPFADVPTPPGCDLTWSYVFEDGHYRYGTLIYEGRASAQEIVDRYAVMMGREDWMYIETLRTGDTIIRYSKKGRPLEHCDIAIGKASWLGDRYVVITVTGTYGP